MTEAILTFRSYNPKRIVKGMLFYVATEDAPFIYECDKNIPKKEFDEFIKLMGKPVLPYLVAPEGKAYTIAYPDKIGFILNEWYEPRAITTEDFNIILSQYNGKVNIETDANGLELLNELVVLSLPEEILEWELLDIIN